MYKHASSVKYFVNLIVLNIPGYCEADRTIILIQPTFGQLKLTKFLPFFVTEVSQKHYNTSESPTQTVKVRGTHSTVKVQTFAKKVSLSLIPILLY